MTQRKASLFLVAALTVGGIAAVTGMRRASDPGLTVHEWGTFTSVAGTDGRAIEWLPLGGPTDLPCFVARDPGRPVKIVAPNMPLDYDAARTNLWGKVRMETPVLYFYSSRATTVEVHVDFPRGLITEFYPKPSGFQATMNYNSLRDPMAIGFVDWKNVQIVPDEHPIYPTTTSASHYFAARETDASPIRVGAQTEKFLFYRGVAGFDVPIRTEPLGDSAIRVGNLLRSHAIPAFVVFENRDGKIGFRIVENLMGETVVRTPTLDGALPDLKSRLGSLLVRNGLTTKEASAMLETWRDSWFEEGTRVFYLLPAQATDDILPLSISPRPATTTRVFVGRMDVLTPATIRIVSRAAQNSDSATLASYARFLAPITDRILASGVDDSIAQKIQSVNRNAFDSYVNRAKSCLR